VEALPSREKAHCAKQSAQTQKSETDASWRAERNRRKGPLITSCSAEVLVGKAIEPGAQLLVGIALGESLGYFGVLED